MGTLLDTDVVVHLRDGDPWVEQQVGDLDPPLFISAITRVELENGRVRAPSATVDQLLAQALTYLEVLDFDAAAIDAYCRIVGTAGYSRRKTADRMTAAVALANDLPLATLNGRDFRDVPGLRLMDWSRSATD